jgi:glycosyltransferase involved in cell wall biosynthesis
MPCSYGKFPPKAEDCEQQCFNDHSAILQAEDIVHDFSVTKTISNNLDRIGYNNLISTIMGGPWTHQYKPHNLVVWSKSHRDRVLRGATDYENTPTPDMAGPAQVPVKEAHVVHGGIDTDFYTPTYNKKDFFLWMNRWHPAKGYKQAIEIAKSTGLKLVMAGEHPDNERFEFQKNCALEAIELAKGHPNISFSFLPKDPDHHTAKRELYRQAKALLYTVQFNEPFGLSQVEALACGTPVIGNNYGSVSELIENGMTGFVRTNDNQALIKAIDMVDVIKPETCRRIAVEKYDRIVMAKSYLQEYNNVMTGKGWT